MNILFVASESYPFLKTGGLADVAYALPKALRKIGVDVRVIMPKYGDIPLAYKEKMQTLSTFNVPVGWRNQYGGLQYLEYDGIPFYFIDNEYYFKRAGGAYGFYDDGERFAYFCRAVLEAIPYMNGFTPDILHCNDWHSGMIMPLLKTFFNDKSLYERIKTVFTIHNLQYQGIFPREILGELFGLSESFYHDDALKFHDNVSFMKGGLNFSDIITTVSNTYAEEIKTPFYGEGVHGILIKRSKELYGIVNGIDDELYNPETDRSIFVNYNRDRATDKVKNKLGLQSELHLPINGDIPMVGMVTRLTSQKGLDLMAHVIEDILRMNLQLVVLGTGEYRYEEMFRYYAGLFPEKLSANIGFNNDLAKKIYAGSDIFLMPSLFEPCGIGQLLALRYGSLPIVRETGGLKDTVDSYNEYTSRGNGFSFTNYNAHDMLYTIKRAIGFYQEKSLWGELVQRAMNEDNSWNQSAEKYKDLYQSMF